MNWRRKESFCFFNTAMKIEAFLGCLRMECLIDAFSIIYERFYGIFFPEGKCGGGNFPKGKKGVCIHAVCVYIYVYMIYVCIYIFYVYFSIAYVLKALAWIALQAALFFMQLFSIMFLC